MNFLNEKFNIIETVETKNGVEKFVIDKKDYVKGENEVVKLSGADAGNYNLYVYDAYPASATYTKN